MGNPGKLQKQKNVVFIKISVTLSCLAGGRYLAKNLDTYRCYAPSLREATLYTYLFEKEMMVSRENKNGLKGQNNLAQGKGRRSVALGWRTGKRIVRAIRIKKRTFSISDER